MKLTSYLIDTLRSQNGGFSHATLRFLGVPIPLRHGWQNRMIDSEVSEENFHHAILAARAHMLNLAKRELIRMENEG